jgi:hypothetical protein
MTMPTRVPISIRARVARYLTRALVNHFDGGRYEAFDATILEVLEPSRLTGCRLTIHHDRPAAEDGPWRTIGPVLSFTIDENLLAEGTQIFSAAANNLRVAS